MASEHVAFLQTVWFYCLILLFLFCLNLSHIILSDGLFQNYKHGDMMQTSSNYSFFSYPCTVDHRQDDIFRACSFLVRHNFITFRLSAKAKCLSIMLLNSLWSQTHRKQDGGSTYFHLCSEAFHVFFLVCFNKDHMQDKYQRINNFVLALATLNIQSQLRTEASPSLSKWIRASLIY